MITAVILVSCRWPCRGRRQTPIAHAGSPPAVVARRAVLATALTILTALLLAGCSLPGSGASTFPMRYTLDAAAPNTRPATSGAAPSPRQPRYTLDLRPVSAPNWLDSRRMLYRLDYVDRARLSAYTRSAWADRPAALIGQRLGKVLSASGLFKAVLADSAGQADLVLQVSLADVSQRFASPRDSQGHITAQGTLLRAADGQVIAQQHFDSAAPAPSANAAGGVEALASADTRLNRAIQRWLMATLATCDRSCASGPAASANTP